MAEEKKSVSKQSKKAAAPKKETPKPVVEKPAPKPAAPKPAAPKAELVQKDEFQALRERLLRDYKGRLTAEQIEQRISIIKESKENN